MSNDRWTETQLIMFLKNWQRCCIEEVPLEMRLWWSFIVLATLQTFPRQSNSSSPFLLLSLVQEQTRPRGLLLLRRHRLIFLFCFASGSVKETDKTESVKENRYCQTDTLERAGIHLKKNTLKRFFWTPSSSSRRPSVVVFALPPDKLPLLRRLCSALCGLPAAKER